ncbi:MAG: Holliday junction resolvase RuvX [Microbacteriaceae bacterium]|jgi:putative Holliday junction resolvase|nr:Holliday junction resolvase RuvX [Microbacteriaceae bacterium]MCI1206774.1 Holliday junction resolvase RuvX [Microbacteriaceae bacterium]
MAARLGVDIGRARVGIACCDSEATLAYPIETVQRSASTDLDELGARIAALAREYECERIYVGLPLNLRGERTLSTEDALDCARRISTHTGLPVFLQDERFTTNIAAQQLRPSGRKRARSRQVIDQAAAVAILQSALEVEQRTGAPAGTPIEAYTDV